MEGHLQAVIAARDEVSKIVRHKQEQRAALDTEIASLTTEMEGLNLYIARHGVTVITASPDEAVRWCGLPRTDAIVEVLLMMDEPGSPREISDHLRRVGRTDDPADVGRALARLKDQNRVISRGRGLWAPSDTSGQDTSPDQDKEPPATVEERRPEDQEWMVSDDIVQTNGAVM